MSQQIMIWSLIATVAALAIIIGVAGNDIKSFHLHDAAHSHHSISMAKDWEILYLPGDKLHPDDDKDSEYTCDDF